MGIKAKYHFRAFPFVFSIIAIWIVVLWLVRFDLLFVYVFLGGGAFLLGPALFLHLEYYFEDRHKNILITTNTLTVLVNGTPTVTLTRDEIKRVVLYQSAALVSGSIHLPNEYYFYVRIEHVKSSVPIFVTSLMLSESVDELYGLSNLTVEKAGTFFASLRYPVGLRLLK